MRPFSSMSSSMDLILRVSWSVAGSPNCESQLRLLHPPGHVLLCVLSTRFALLLDTLDRVVDQLLFATPVQGGVVVDDSRDEVRSRDVASSNSLEPIPSSSPFEYFWENSSSAWRAALSPIVGLMIVSPSDGAVWIHRPTLLVNASQ